MLPSMTDTDTISRAADRMAQGLAEAPWYAVLLPHWTTVLGAVLFLYVCGRQLADRRPPGNILAWGLLILLSPGFGLLCFILIGERKRREMRRLRRAVSRVTRATPEPGRETPHPTRFTPLTTRDGVAHYDLLVAKIAGAQNHILITTYIFADDATGRAIVGKLAEAARRGVHVRLLIDALGSRGAGDTLFAPLIAAGGRMVRFMPVAPWKRAGGANLRNHRKLAIFDGRSAIVGGRNIAESYLGPTASSQRYRDFALHIEGDGVAELTQVFASDWCFASDEQPARFFQHIGGARTSAHHSAVEVIAGGPDQENDPIWEKLVTLLAQAREEIVIITPYLVPDEVLLRLMAGKARAGVKVRIITPRRSDHRIADFARRHHVRVLRQAGASVHYYDDAFLHGKLVIVDREIAVIGSANFDMRSLFINFELALVVRDPATTAAFTALANELADASMPAGRHRNRATGWFDRIAESVAHLLAPLL